MERSFGVVGGDRRQAELCRLLRRDGHTVRTFGLEAWTAEADTSPEAALSSPVVVLPLPVCGKDGRFNCGALRIRPEELLERFAPNQLVLAGRVPEDMARLAADKGLAVEDYFAREELTVANAAITAEGAIQVAMEHLDRTLLGMECLVLGFGRIGKLLCRRLQGLGARVTAFARNPADRAWAAAYGYGAVDPAGLPSCLEKTSLVFNTVPSLLLDRPLLERLLPAAVLVDLASEPGVDLAAAEAAGHTALWATSLPGRLSPASAALAIRDTVYHILEERGDPA